MVIVLTGRTSATISSSTHLVCLCRTHERGFRPLSPGDWDSVGTKSSFRVLCGLRSKSRQAVPFLGQSHWVENMLAVVSQVENLYLLHQAKVPSQKHKVPSFIPGRSLNLSDHWLPSFAKVPTGRQGTCSCLPLRNLSTGADCFFPFLSSPFSATRPLWGAVSVVKTSQARNGNKGSS